MAVSLISKLYATCAPKCERCAYAGDTTAAPTSRSRVVTINRAVIAEPPCRKFGANYTDPAWKVHRRVRYITRRSVGRSMQAQLHTAAERERSQLLAAQRTSLRGEVTALQRVRELEQEPAARIGKSGPGIERRRGVGQSVDGESGR